MQQIERYGVIVLVFFLVTIVAVSFWGDSKSPGFWARLTGKGQPKKEQNEPVAKNLGEGHIVDPNVPLSPGTNPIPPVAGTSPLNGNVTTPADLPPYTPAPPVPDTSVANNPFVPNANPVVANPAVPNPTVPNSTPQAPIAHVDAPQATTASYVVEKGDSFASIAKHKLGDESRWTEIQALNGGVNPKNLHVGQTLVLPSGSVKQEGVILSANTHKTAPVRATDTKKTADAKKPAPAVAKETQKSGSYYTVKKGDGLRAIARAELGDESRWKDIVAANPGMKADQIFVGQKLRMPGTSVAHTSSGPAALASIQGHSTGDEPRVR
jgi:nucleoid-associated protein YgaU